jgi:hypothetical protein
MALPHPVLAHRWLVDDGQSGSNNCHRTSRGWSALEDDFRIFPCARNAASPKIDVAKFKDATSVNRKYTIPLL